MATKSKARPEEGAQPAGISMQRDEAVHVRRMLLVGLASYGEIVRLRNAEQVIEMGGASVPDELRSIHPTGAADTVSEFADALRLLDSAIEVDHG